MVLHIIWFQVCCYINITDIFLKKIARLRTALGNMFDFFCWYKLNANASICNLFSSPLETKLITTENSSLETASIAKLLRINVDSKFIFKDILMDYVAETTAYNMCQMLGSDVPWNSILISWVTLLLLLFLDILLSSSL